jgi:hypothetical protein
MPFTNTKLALAVLAGVVDSVADEARLTKSKSSQEDYGHLMDLSGDLVTLLGKYRETIQRLSKKAA